MSLLKRLWVSVVVAMVLVLSGAVAVSLWTARTYFEQQLTAQASDGAVSLALSMSQQKKDQATAELLVAALFDGGHYRSIRLVDMAGRVIVERSHRDNAEGVPAWLSKLLPMEVHPGQAHVSDGWRPVGQITVEAARSYAYASLWRGMLQLGSLMLAVGIFWGMAVSMLLRWVERPLGEMAAQAEAVGEGRFRILQEPAVLELRSMAKALNRMSGRVQSLFSEQASRIEALHNESSVDPVTGLPNRSAFMGELRQALTDVAGPPSGCLAVVKLDDLAALNRQFGRERTDLWLLSLARRLQGTLLVAPGTTLARLSGAEFAWLAPGMTVAEAQAQLAAAPALGGLEEEGQERPSVQIHVGGAAYERGDAVSELLARVDLALMRAETTGDPVLDGGEGRLPEQTPGAEAWSSLLQAAVNDQIFALEGYPVLQAGGALIHREYMLRLPWKGHLLSAGQFMPAAVRLGLAGACDLEALRLGMGRLAALPEDRIALNLAPQSLTEDGFLDRLDILLATAGESARRISVEVSERGLDASLSGIEPLAEVLGRHGVGLGIEHFGRQLAALPRLYALRLAYLKLDGSIVAGLPDHEGQQRLVKAIVDVARGLEIPVYAGQVHTAGEWDMARRLGVSGMTGPEASRRASAP